MNRTAYETHDVDDLDFLKRIPGATTTMTENGEVINLPAGLRFVTGLDEEEMISRMSSDTPYWIVLIVGLLFAGLLFRIQLIEERQVDRPADNASTKYIEERTEESHFPASATKLVPPPNSLPVLVISQLANTNKCGSKSCPLDYMLANTLYGDKQRKYQDNKATKNNEFVPFIHNHFADHLDHKTLPPVPVNLLKAQV